MAEAGARVLTMPSVIRAKLADLDPAERAEIETVLDAHRRRDPELSARFHSDYLDAVAWWLWVVLFGTIGAGALAYEVSYDGLGFVTMLPEMIREFGLFSTIYGLKMQLGLVAVVAVLIWTVVVWVQNHKRRGCAITNFGIVRIRGRKVTMMRYSEIASAEATKHGGGRRGQRFTVLHLTGKDGARLNLYVNGGWAELAMKELSDRGCRQE